MSEGIVMVDLIEGEPIDPNDEDYVNESYKALFRIKIDRTDQEFTIYDDGGLFDEMGFDYQDHLDDLEDHAIRLLTLTTEYRRLQEERKFIQT